MEGNYYFANKTDGVENSKSGYSQIGLYGNLNLMNTFAGYKGEPRDFEIYFLTGLYWGHNYGDLNNENNILVNKIAFDFAYNFGSDKEWQVYLEPSINYAIAGVESSRRNGYMVDYRLDRSFLNINAGIIYKLKGSNGKHNFALVAARDEAR